MAKTRKISHSSGIKTVKVGHLDGFYEQRGENVLLPARLVGLTPLLQHAWGQKALIQLIGTMTGWDMPQANKDLMQEYEEAFYRNTKGEAVIPCRIIKRCILDGALATKKAVFKTDLGKYLRVEGLTAPIEGEARMDIRPASVGGRNRSVDIRARPVFDEWAVEVILRFNPNNIPVDKVLLALQSAGDAIGLCEWRPSAKQPGEYGCFSVENVEVKQLSEIMARNKWPEKTPTIPEAFLRAAGSDLKVPKQAQNAVDAALGKKKNGAGISA
jgi:hypothetical protein